MTNEFIYSLITDISSSNLVHDLLLSMSYVYIPSGFPPKPLFFIYTSSFFPFDSGFGYVVALFFKIVVLPILVVLFLPFLLNYIKQIYKDE